MRDDRLMEAMYHAGRNVVTGTSGKDRLASSGANAIVFGGDGNDVLTAHGDDVVLVGGRGDDRLQGMRGEDPYYWGTEAGKGRVIYVWGKGDGNDTINNVTDLRRARTTKGTAYLRLGAGISLETLSFERGGDQLVLRNKETQETVTIENWFVDDAYKLDGLMFADGTMMETSELWKRAETFLTTDGKDQLVGSSGADILDGGKGDDELEGGAGDDTYIWSRGDGNDIIRNAVRKWNRSFDPGADTLRIYGATADELAWSHAGNDLFLTDRVTGERITFADWHQDKLNRLHTVVLEDGTTWTSDQIDAMVQTMQGTEQDDVMQGGDALDDRLQGGAGNDKLYGNDGNDILEGGPGDDYLEGGYGDDTYLWRRGDGNDIIHNVMRNWRGNSLDVGNDTLKIYGVAAEELKWGHDGNNLILTDSVTGEHITVEDWHQDKLNRLHTVMLEDGSTWTSDQIDSMAQTMQGTDQEDVLRGGDMLDDRMFGGAGNDQLFGNGGDDLLDGGEGDDVLTGWFGDDTYIWGRGYGHDVIKSAVHSWTGAYLDAGSDKLEVKGFCSDDLQWSVKGKDVILSDHAMTNSVTFEEWKGSDFAKLSQISFEDGTVLTRAQVDEYVRVIEDRSLEFYTPMSESQTQGITSKENHLVVAATHETKM